MKDTKLKLKSPDEVEAVYYEAFAHCDARVMAALWADGDVVCIHPGSGTIIGHEAVARSWQHIFTDAQQAEIKFTTVKKTLREDLAVHLLTEEIGSSDEVAIVLATNVYQKFDHGWLMIEHHSSLVQSRPPKQTVQ